MADFTNPDGVAVAASVNKLRQQLAIPWVKQMELEGRVFAASIGTGVSPVDFVETTYDENQPQFALLVPEGTICVPISASLSIQDMLGTDNTVAMEVCSNDIGNGTSTEMTTEGNVNGAFGSTNSRCTARQLYTGDAAAAVNIVEITHRVNAFADGTGSPEIYWKWTMNEMPLMQGDASMFLHVNATTDGPIGFFTIKWAEFKTTELV